jgi:hypothetical protein
MRPQDDASLGFVTKRPHFTHFSGRTSVSPN